jgi:Imidazolonepropionase and related amidohydrolases
MLVLKGRVVDGTGVTPIEKGVVVIDDNKIKLVAKECDYTVPEGVEVIEVAQGTIMPGFIEQHSHLGVGSVNAVHKYTISAYEKTCHTLADMERLIEAGFTTVREVAGIANRIKEAVQNGVVRGTRIFASGKAITQTAGHFDSFQKLPIELDNDYRFLADGVPAVRHAARMQFREKADFLKIATTGGVTCQGNSNKTSQYSISEIEALVEEAEMNGTYVATHAMGTQGIKNALKAGVKSIEHGCFMDEECIELMVKNGAWLVPTFSVEQKLMNNIETIPAWVKPKLLAGYEAHYKSFEMCHKAGIKIGLGADFLGDPIVCPYGENGMEFERLVYAGMTPMEAIVAGTKTGAEIIMRADELGTLQEGKLADITVVKGNPLENIKILQDINNIKLVILDGKIVKRIQ